MHCERVLLLAALSTFRSCVAGVRERRAVKSRRRSEAGAETGEMPGVNCFVLHVVTLMESRYHLIVSRAFLNRVGGYSDTAREVIDGFS